MMKKLRRFVPWLLTLAFLSGCKCTPGGEDAESRNRKTVILSDLNQIRYPETYENGETYQIFA